MSNKIKIQYFFIILFINSFFFLNLAFAKKYSEIKVSGNERLTVETIVMFSGLNLDKELNNQDLNNAIKNLFQTNYFKDIKFEIKNNVLQINVIENPIIQSISINGIKNSSIEDQLYDIVKEKEKSPFLLYEISEQKNLLLNVLKKSGFYFVKVDVETKENLNNSIDLIYKFDLGERAKIYKIKFIKNKKFKNIRKKNIII